MESFLDLYKKSNSLHHAYFFVGDVLEIKKSLLNFFDKTLKYKTFSNPDFSDLSFENLSVDDARFIRESSEKKNILGGKMIFMISFESVSLEAQNSLLKVVEEPTGETYFFFVSPQDSLLSTLKSRMQVVKFKINNSKPETSESFFLLNLKERLQKVKDIVDSISDEEESKQSAVDFVNGIEEEIYKRGVVEKARELSLCTHARDSLFQRGAPIKMILENLVLSI